jgi:membrane-associated phospholipid phosphatase
MDERGVYSSQDAYMDIQNAYPKFHTNADDILQFMPLVAVYGLNLIGVKGKNNFIDRTLIYMMSVTMAEITTDGLKNKTHILRPDSSDYRSFPSGHTTNAFVCATFLFNEYKEVSIWYGVAGYSVATATGVLRMLNNKHWMSDVLVGAGVGIFFTELTYYVYPIIKDFVSNRIIHRDLQALSFSPYYSSDNMGIYLNIRF